MNVIFSLSLGGFKKNQEFNLKKSGFKVFFTCKPNLSIILITQNIFFKCTVLILNQLTKL